MQALSPPPPPKHAIMTWFLLCTCSGHWVAVDRLLSQQAALLYIVWLPCRNSTGERSAHCGSLYPIALISTAILQTHILPNCSCKLRQQFCQHYSYKKVWCLGTKRHQNREQSMHQVCALGMYEPTSPIFNMHGIGFVGVPNNQ